MHVPHKKIHGSRGTLCRNFTSVRDLWEWVHNWIRNQENCPGTISRCLHSKGVSFTLKPAHLFLPTPLCHSIPSPNSPLFSPNYHPPFPIPVFPNSTLQNNKNSQVMIVVINWKKLWLALFPVGKQPEFSAWKNSILEDEVHKIQPLYYHHIGVDYSFNHCHSFSSQIHWSTLLCCYDCIKSCK